METNLDSLTKGGDYAVNQDAMGRQMYDATCSKCGQPTQVPFQPTGDRPVYCSNCFKEVRGERGEQRGGRGGGFGGGTRQMFDVTCSSCGQPTQVPFQPTEGRPVYCRDCFHKQRG